MSKREVTEFDLRAPQFQHPEVKPSDFEFRDDGKIVRKDRFEQGFRSLVEPAGFSLRNYEIDDVVTRVEETFAALEELDLDFVLAVLRQAKNVISVAENVHPAYLQDTINCITKVEKLRNATVGTE